MKIVLPLVFFIHSFAVTAQKFNEFLQQCEANGFRGSVLVASKGKVLLEQGYGLADAEANRKETANTVFCIGSITKQFTAAGVMKLADENKLRVTDKLSKFFPESPAAMKDITVHQLLTHTAGLAPALGDDYDLVNASDFMKLVFSQPLQSTPGAQYHYSNVGYSILGIIIEKVSGMGYEQYLHTKLFQPAGMLRTGYLIPKFDKKELAVGYRDGIRWGTALDHAWMPDGPGWHLRANGGILSTAGDMHTWYVALRNNKVLSKAATEQLLARHVAEDPQGTSYYGYGWVWQKTDNGEFNWHNGGNGVYNAFMGFSLKDDWCLMVSSNTNKIISDKIATQLLKILNGGEAAPLPQSIIRSEPPFMTSPVTLAIFQQIVNKGGEYFESNYDEVLRQAGFDFEDDMILFGVGEKLKAEMRWENARSLYTVYSKLFPNIVVAWNQLGRCYKQLGNNTKARECFEKSLSIRPVNNPAKQLLEEL